MDKENAIMYELVLTAFFFVFIVLGLIDHKNKLELIKIKNNYHLKQEYINNLEVIVDIIRKEKHDFANHINTVYAMCIMNREDALDRIKEYLKKTTNNIQDSYRFYDTGNSYVDGLVAVKSNYAFENNIYLDVDFETPLNAILTSDNDLIAVIGNILDNAMYAVSTEDKEEKKIVSIYGYIENNKYHLSISNNGPMIPKEIQNKIFKKGFSTKKENKAEHGFGLYIVNDIVQKNGGQILLSSSPEETEFLIEFKIKEEYYEENCSSTYKTNI
jgi:sensor histidine kinase regulating citrate/malate metabolism